MAWPKGKPRSEVDRQRISAAMRGKQQRLGQTHPADCGHCEAMRKPMPVEIRGKISAKMKSLFANDAYFRARLLEHLSGIQSPTKLEDAVGAMVLAAYPGEMVVREYRIGRFRADWAIPALRLVFEADGSYWHSLPGAAERDTRRDEWLTQQGWTVVRVQEQDIKNPDELQAIIQQATPAHLWSN